MLEHYKDYKFPDLDKLDIKSDTSHKEAIEGFLKNNFPLNVKRLQFSLISSKCESSNLSEFVDDLVPQLKNVKEYANISDNFLIHECIQKIVKACSHLDTLSFTCCTANLDNCQFEEADYKLKNLYFIKSD